MISQDFFDEVVEHLEGENPRTLWQLRKIFPKKKFNPVSLE